MIWILSPLLIQPRIVLAFFFFDSLHHIAGLSFHKRLPNPKTKGKSSDFLALPQACRYLQEPEMHRGGSRESSYAETRVPKRQEAPGRAGAEEGLVGCRSLLW